MKLDEKKIKKLSSNLSTPLSEISYVLLAYALFTDGNVSEEENQAAIQITLDLGNDWNYEQDDIVSAYREATEVCNGASKEELQAVFIDVLAKLDHQEDFKLAQRKRLIGYLESIMDADGVQHKNEIFYIGKIKELLKLEEGKALEKLGTTKKDLAEKVVKSIAAFSENPAAHDFVKAVSAKDAVMQDIIDEYEDVFEDYIDFADEDGYTAMHYACWDNKLLIVEMLIDFGANPNVVSPTNETPLNMAVGSGHFDIVKFFVDYDVEMELNIEWEKRNTTPNPFHPEKGSTLIRDAILNQHWDIFDLLINGIAPNLDVLTEPCSVGFEGETNFFLAIEKLYQKENIDYDKERLETIRSTVEGSSNQETNNEERTVSDENRSTLDRITFFLLSFAQNDGIVKEELQEVASIIESLLGDSFSFDKFKTGADWFQEEMEKVEWNREDKGLKAILKECIAVVEDFFGKSEPPAKRLFINQVIGIANVDGQVGKSEIDWIERLCKGIDIEIPNILDEDPERRWDVEEEDDNKGYPGIRVRNFKDKEGNKDAKKQKLVSKYMMNWHEPTEEYNGRLGITARIPDFFESINKNCPKWTSDEITNIKNYITKYKVIPTLRYAPEEFNSWTKQVWWLAPFVFVEGPEGEIASWMFIDKNGFYVAHPSDNDGTLIFTWDNITDMDTDWLEDNLVMLTLYGEHDDNEIELRICEFVSEGNGSYLEVMESIYSVYEKTIEESRGSSAWSHGSGGEGYEGFDNPKELLDEKKWKAVKPTNPSMYGSSFEEIKTVDQKEKGSNTKEISTQEDLLEQIREEENNDEVVLSLVRYFEANKMTEKESLLLTQQILEINKDAQVVAELARLLINAGQNKDFAVSLLKDKKEYTGDDFSFEVFDKIKAELIGEKKNIMDLNIARARFIEIANKTGINGDNVKQEPNTKERDELWDITRSFLNRIYVLDDKKDLSKEELKEYNELCYWSISALHWNDYFGESPLQHPGRFRRDTIALALCLYIRISKDYELHKNIEEDFIIPHAKGSVILWICSEMKIAERDIYFDKFDIEFIKKADEQRRKFFFDRGGLFLSKEEDNEEDYDKIVEILYELLDTFYEEDGRSFPKFILTYIKTLKELLPEDLENNTKYIESILSSSSTPESTEDMSKEITNKMLDDGYTGQGTYTFSDGAIYIGKFKDGNFHGQGTMTYPDGENYVGEHKDDLKHGQGTYTYADGENYVGEFKDGNMHGKGTYTYASGSKYVGEWKDDLKHGQGTYTFANGTIKEGLFENNEFLGPPETQKKEPKEDKKESQVKVTIEMMQQGFDGKGLFDAPDGSKYEGDFKAGRFSGKGKLIWPDGENYDGDWKDGNPNGKGIYNFTNGDVYDGEFKNGEKSGSGKFIHGPGDWEGDVYEGEWKNDQRSGHGVITFGSGEFKGEKYDGQWKDGKRNGKGTYDFADGTSFIGTWKDGECVEKEVELKTENKVLSKDSPIWEIIQHEFINLGKRTSVFKKEFSNLILSKYPHIKKGTLSAQIAIQVINKRSRTNYYQCGKERVCGDNKFDFLFEQEDKTLCKYDKSKHGTWEIYKRDDGKLDVRIVSK